MMPIETAAMRRPQVVTHGDELRRQVLAWRAAGQRVGLVPTMGALHAGHLSLVARSGEECDRTIVTIFVNPMQFGPNEDFRRYPRMLDKDSQLLAGTPTDVIFAPPTEEIYRGGHATFVEVEGVARLWEGASRPGHFRGVATVVLKLFNLAPSDIAYFGQKDYQQSVVVRRMAADLNLPIQIRVCPIVREPDGLALSSRNAYLSAEDRSAAVVLSRSLRLAADLVRQGQRDAKFVARQMRNLIESADGVELDYAVLVDPETLKELGRIEGPAVALVAAKVGQVRLIDNEIIDPTGAPSISPR
jgi:pantoate--beta-alanine ligase